MCVPTAKNIQQPERKEENQRKQSAKGIKRIVFFSLFQFIAKQLGYIGDAIYLKAFAFIYYDIIVSRAFQPLLLSTSTSMMQRI